MTIRGVLGSGAMGIVYRAFDRHLGRDVAVKKLRNMTGRDLYRFKREFRSLADIVHPNLVTLHELHTDRDQWFVTMELIDGVPFIDWVRHWPSDETVTAELDGREAAPGRARQRILEAPLDFARLDSALAQLIDGVLALHACGKLHRDLKPANVLVTDDGRVVLLDFGLVSAIGDSVELTHHDAAVGTPAYMSPEQAADLRLSEASDWYAVGAMLYEALTGRRPFEGSTAEVLRRKQVESPAPAVSLAPFVPPELDALCMKLLAVDPAARPGRDAILAALHRTPSTATLQLEQSKRAQPFVGRIAELAALDQAMADSRSHTVTMLVSGESGIGKTRLVRRFLEHLSTRALILEGACYERESVPFKALDGVIDAIASALLRLPEDAVRAALPRDVGALARLFPALHRVPAIAERSTTLPASPVELRRRAATVLRALLGWLGTVRPVVITIDDLQWGDADSAAFLIDLVHHTDPLPLLLILIHRIEGDGGLVATVRSPPPELPGGDVRSLSLGPLGDEEALDLTRLLAGQAVEAAVVREAGGHPLFLIELVRASRDATAPTSLDALIAQRTAALPAAAAELLRVIAVAGRPLLLIDAARASGLRGVGTELSLLLAEHLVRLRHLGADEATYVEPYHERIRAAVIASLDDAGLRQVHEALTRTFEETGEPSDLDALAAHCLAAGDPRRAARYALQAARLAEVALAFHRAAELYALALAHGDGDAANRRSIHRRRGEALANAGRLDEAAGAFAEAARGAPADEALDVDHLRLEQLLRLGRLGEGMSLANRLLEQIGVELPASRAEIARELWARRRRRWRQGYALAARAGAAPSIELRRVDLLGSITMAIAVNDPLIGSLLQSHFLDAALEVGEPRRACIALSIELGYLSQLGTRARARIDRLAAHVHELAAQIGEPYVIGVATAMHGLASFELGDWTDARVRLENGIQIMSDHGSGVRWEVDVAELFHLGALVYLGETNELARRVPVLLRDALERGDVYAERGLRAWRPNLAWLIMAQPEVARAQLMVVGAERSADEPFQLRHYYELASHLLIDLYIADADGAFQRIETAWPPLAASGLLRIQIVRIEAAFLRARAALAQAAVRPELRRVRIELARTIAGDLDRERAAWARALSLQVTAMVAALEGDRAAAAEGLEVASRAYDDCDMGLHRTVASMRSGELTAGAVGAARAATARRALTASGIIDPDAIARMLCPLP